MIDDTLLAAWLAAVDTELSVPYFIGPRIPEFGSADVLGVVTPSPGLGLVLEGINQVVGFQIRWVAREANYAKLKRSAYLVDRTLMFVDFPTQLWGGWVTSVNRAGGEPSPELGDGRDLDRVAFTCTYLVETEL